MRVLTAILCTALAGCGMPQYCKPLLEQNRQAMAEKTDDDMGWIVTALSQMRYGGHDCLCPQDKDTNGNSCGARSAYSRSGGISVYCYGGEVPAAKKQQAREYGAVLAMPQACGGAGNHMLLNYPDQFPQ